MSFLGLALSLYDRRKIIVVEIYRHYELQVFGGVFGEPEVFCNLVKVRHSRQLMHDLDEDMSNNV